MKYFGTDGIRGVANLDLTPEFAVKVGKAAGLYFKGDLIVSKDPRLSSDSLESALISGILSTGVNVYSTGILPTPALSLLLKINGKSGGAMISASHNPIEYNGIKFFNRGGIKLSEKEEEEIEKIIDEGIFSSKIFDS
ncbi:MAG: phosphoglucosamine mutase, partial [Caldisericia bacterium]|nr:phosphoglucosamine mutase [Caldisericia bacterium]